MANPRRDTNMGGAVAALPGSQIARVAPQVESGGGSNFEKTKNPYPNTYTLPEARFQRGIVVAEKVEHGPSGKSNLVQTVIVDSGEVGVRTTRLDTVRRGELIPARTAKVNVSAGQAGPDANAPVRAVSAYPPIAFRPIEFLVGLFRKK